MLAQSLGICVTHVVDPTLHTRVEFSKRECASLVRLRASNCIAGAQPTREPRSAVPQESAKPEEGSEERGRTQHHTETHIVVAIVRVIPVAIRTARVVSMIDPRAAAQNLSRPPDRMLATGLRTIALRKRWSRIFSVAGEVSPAPPREFRASDDQRSASSEVRGFNRGPDSLRVASQDSECGSAITFGKTKSSAGETNRMRFHAV